jgi:hypothetical protein
MRHKPTWILLFGGCAFALLCLFAGIGLGLFSYFRPQPEAVKQELFQGVSYQRIVKDDPRSMVIHVITVDLRADGIQFLVTPGNPEAELPLEARTTTNFLEEFNLQIAVNGDGFQPWHSRTIFDYYPHSGDPIRPLGLAASRGEIYSNLRTGAPVLYISRANQARFNTPIGRVYNALSGDSLLVWQGKPLPAPGGSPEPRSAVALDKAGKRLLIFVVDGRQINYSGGATLAELAQIIVDNGGHSAMNLDGGGSSTLVRQGRFGRAALLNRPINHQIPGWQRPVGNHLGVFAKPVNDQ